MAKKFLTGLNLVVLNSDPATGSEGELYFNSSASVAKIYQAGVWSVLGAGGGGGGTTVSTTEPLSPEIGDSWYKNDTGEFYVYDGTYWVEVNGVISLSQEEVQDYVAPLFTHNNHVNASVHYEDELNELHIEVTSAPTAGFTSTLKHDVRLNGSIAKGQAVYVSSANGTNMVVSKASNASEATSSKTLGLLETGGSNNSLVKVVTEGILAGLDTSAANSEGDPVWLGTNGNLIYGLANKPYAPAHLVFIGVVTRKNSSNGEIFVKVQNGFELREIHDVGIGYGTQVGDDEVLKYNASASLWINDLSEELLLKVYNNSGSVIPALSPVYYVEDTVNGINVAIADSNSVLDPNKLPAIGITKSSIANGSYGNIITYGKITGINTNDFNSNDSLFVASGGGLTSSRPTGTANVQEVGKVLVGQSASAGQILVYNTGRKNDIPNLAEGKVWVGNVTSYPVATTLNTAAVPEGPSGPYYFTDERAVDALDSTLSNYLLNSSASSTYLTQTNATNTYLTQSNASATYQPIGSYLTSETDPVFTSSDAYGIDSTDISNWNTAYGWGDHGSAGYLTSETDPVFTSSDAYGIDSTDISNWNTAYGWGNHASAGYAASSHNHTLDSLSNVVITGSPTDGQAIVWDTTTSKWVNETVSGGGASYPDQTGNNGKFLQTNGASVSWQNVDFTGYLTESSASSTYLTQASASSTYQPIGSYLTSESDTLETVTDRGATSSNAITISNTTQSTTPTSGALIISGGVGIAKDVWIDGDLHVNGTTVTENTKTVSTHDNLIYLNAAQDSVVTNAVGNGTYVTYTADNDYTPGMDIRVTGMDPSGYNIASSDNKTIYSATSTQFVVAKTNTGTFVSGGTAHAKEEANPDLGFAGGYYSGGYAHAGLFRDASDGVFKFFQGYTPEPDEAVNIDTDDASFELAKISIKGITLPSPYSSIGIGYLSGNFSGDSNYAFGNETLSANTGGGNYGIGWLTLGSNTGYENYAIGKAALVDNTGNTNYAFGDLAGRDNTGSDNLFLGHEAGTKDTSINSGNYNVYIGKTYGLSTNNNILIADNEGNLRAQYLSADFGWTLGTIYSATWNGSAIDYQYGGTGLTTLGTAGQVLKVNAGANAIEWGDASGGSSFTNSSELAALLSDETGSGSVVFSNSPTFTGTVSGITKSMVGLENVENTTLSTWAGSTNITTLGTISSGTWNGSVIGDSYINDALTISGGTINNTPIGAITASTGRFTSVNINGQAIIEGSTGTTSATSSFNTTVYSSAEFIVYGSTASGNYVSKVLMLARGTATPVITEYAILTQGTAPTVTITPSYSAPNAVLTVAVTSGTNIKIIATEVSI